MTAESLARENRSRGISVAILVALWVFGAVLCAYALRRHTPPAVDSRLRTGSHLTFVVFAPTGKAGAEFAMLVDSGRNAMRRLARQRGYLFSTIGVSDDWDVQRALGRLRELGDFDELVVGRNWLNTGVEKYITELGGLAAVPQVLVAHRLINADSIPLKYGAVTELARIVGRAELADWVHAGFPLRELRRWEDGGKNEQ